MLERGVVVETSTEDLRVAGSIPLAKRFFFFFLTAPLFFFFCSIML